MINNTKLDNILDVAPEATTAARSIIEEAAELMALQPKVEVLEASPVPILPMPIPDPHNADLKDDVDYAREQIKDLIDSGRLAVQGALELAEAGDQPRAYEVVATMITAIVQANKELVTLHKTKKDATKEDASSGSTLSQEGNVINIEKAVFIGRAQDLLRETLKARESLRTELVVSVSASDKSDNAPDA